MPERLLLIDTNSIIYRAYFAIPALTTTKGELSNAVFGFASILLKAFEQVRPEHAAAALDLPQPTFRHERDATYKATRRPMPDDLRPQIERCKQFLDVFGIPIFALPGYEADDVIGALARQAETAGLEVMIVSGDLDTLQLVTPRVKLMTTRQGFQNTVIYDEAAIAERFAGLRPDQMVEYKALKGDTTDNIPGVPGIGEKTASKLVAEHRDIEGVYASLGTFTERIRRALEEHRDQVFRNREQARIVTDLPVQLDLERTRRGAYDRAKVLDLFRELEFRSLVPRLPPADGNVMAPAATPPATQRVGQLSLGLEPEAAHAPPVATHVVDEAEIRDTVRQLRAAGTVAVFADVELGRHPALLGVALATGGSCWYIPAPGRVPAELDALLRDESVRVVVHDAKTARRALRRAGSDLGGVAIDTMLASYLVNASRRQHLLDDLAQERLGLVVPVLPVADRKDPHRIATIAERAARAGASASATARLGALFTDDLERLELTTLYRTVELPLVDVLVEMEENGIAVDQPYLAELAREFQGEVARIEREAHEAVGHAFGINSPKQLQDLLFTELKLPRGRRTGTGYSTDAAVLEELRGTHPVLERILEYREIEKLRSTYADGLGPLIDADGRIHTTYEQAVASTGRLSSRAPNLQNIPIRTPLGRRIRRAFVAGGPGRTLVAADYSQIELRIIAHVTQDPGLIEAFRQGADIHRRTAAAGFGVREQDVTREQRDVAKMLNFGIAYGMTDFGLAARMGMPREEAARFIEEYFKRYPHVRRYAIETKALCMERGYVETLLGRRRYIPDMGHSNFAVRNAAERMAINMPIQGTAADIMKIAMIRVRERLRTSGLEALLCLQVHDELVLDVAARDVDAVASLVSEEMAGACTLDVPVVVDVRTGQNWDEMTRVAVAAGARAS